MSSWIYVTSLPHYITCRQDVMRIFEKDIGSIRRCEVNLTDSIMRSTTAFVQYKQSKHARLAAHKKDNTIVDNRAIQVFLVWTQKESLSTIIVANLPRYVKHN